MREEIGLFDVRLFLVADEVRLKGNKVMAQRYSADITMSYKNKMMAKRYLSGNGRLSHLNVK